MKKLFVFVVAAAMSVMSAGALAQDVAVDTGDMGGQPDNIMAVGAYLGMGMSLAVGSDTDAFDPKFAGGFGAYFDFYIMPMLALTGGMDFQNKGYRFDNGGDIRVSYFYLDIPLGAKLNINNFRAALMVSLNFALAGKYKSDEYESDVEDWDNFRRFNLSPKIALGYGIPIGPITIVPGISWSMHLLKDAKDIPTDSIRNMLILFTAGAEFGF